MRRVKRVIVLILIVMLCYAAADGSADRGCRWGKHLDCISLTHDTHSHLNSYSTIVMGNKRKVGGLQGSKH